MKSNEPALFVWRGSEIFPESLGTFNIEGLPGKEKDLGTASACPFCSSSLETKFTGKGDYFGDEEFNHLCLQCGFRAEYFETIVGLGEGIHGGGDAHVSMAWNVARLKKLALNSSELGIAEVGTYLKKNFRDIYGLAPRRFEKLVEDVFRNLGYRTTLTKKSRDGGYDILLSDTDGNQVLVECKRYARHRRVRVSAVRELLGVQLRRGVRFGKLVTTTLFTEPARGEALEVNSGVTGFHLDLIDLEELAHQLSVYNEELPPQELFRRFGKETKIDM